MKSKLFILFTAAMIGIGCKKQVNNPAVQLLSSVTHSNGTTSDITSFTYDDQNRLIDYANNVSKYDYKYSYDSNNQIIEQDYTSGSIFTQYLYNYATAGLINVSVTNKLNGNVTSTATNIYTLNAKQQTTKLDYGGGQYSLYTYDTDSNFLSQSDYGPTSTSPLFQFSYSCDQQKSYFLNIAGNFFIINPSLHTHNSVLETYTSYTANAQYVTTYTSSFEYDGNGYPVKEVRVKKTPTGTVTTDTYAYNYITR